MNVNESSNIKKFHQLINQKEQEWKDLLQKQIDSLVTELGEKDENLKLEKLRFYKLKDDFQYNLNLLSDRDKDLKRYDGIFQQLKANDALQNTKLSDMKIQLDDADIKYKLLQKEASENQKHYQMRLQEYQDEMTTFYSLKEAEVDKERAQYEHMKMVLHQKIRDIEEDACYMKQKMLSEVSSVSNQKESEFRVKLDKKDDEIHSLLLKIKMLSTEIEMNRVSSSKTIDDFEEKKEHTQTLEKKLKEHEWELQDLKSMNGLKFQELKLHSEEKEKYFKNREEELSKKCCDLERMLNERERIMDNLKTAFEEREQKLRNEIRITLKKSEEQELLIKKLSWNLSDIKNDKETQATRSAEALKGLELKLHQEQELYNKSTVVKDLELESLRLNEDALRQELQKINFNFNSCKKDLSTALEREKIIENAKTQIELDWRRRYEAKENGLYHRHEEVIQKLTKSKEEALAQVKSLAAELHQSNSLIQLLQNDKQVATKALNDHGIRTSAQFSDSIPEKEFDMPDANDLKIQNEQLRNVIAQMRTDMEMLTQQLNSRTSTPDLSKQTSSTNYLTELENELKSLKVKNRSLESKLEDIVRDIKPPSGKASPKMSDHAVKTHVKELNDTIGLLRNDKVQLTAMVKSKDANISHLRDMSVKLDREKQQLEVVIEGLRYDLTTKEKADQQITKSLKTRVSELELQVQQARSEADIYYKSVVEGNMDNTQVNTKLSELKLQQLCHNTREPVRIITASSPLEESKTIESLKNKLKLAVERIKELTIEREQLIAVSNKLRAHSIGPKGRSTKDEIPLTSPRNLHQYKNELQSKHESLKRIKNKAAKGSVTYQPLHLTDLSQLSNDEAFEESSDVATDVTEDSKNLPHSSPLATPSENSSIKEIWKLLDVDDMLSSSIDDLRQDDQGYDISVAGRKAPAIQRNKTYNNPTKLNQATNKKRKQKIRNYNIKSDR